MDLLFKKYASPFDYLDALIAYGELPRGIWEIWQSAQEEQLWQFYLSNNPLNEKSFEQWKQDQLRETLARQPMSKEAVAQTVEKSQNILKTFKLPNKDK